MFTTNAGDVIGQMMSVMSILGPIYAFFFGLMALRALMDTVANKIFPKPVKKKAAKRPRTRVRYDRKQYPGLRVNYNKTGFTVSYFDDVKKAQPQKLRRAK
jgi:hypothetical protein